MAGSVRSVVTLTESCGCADADRTYAELQAAYLKVCEERDEYRMAATAEAELADATAAERDRYREVTEREPVPTTWTGWQDLVWLVAHEYEVSIEAGSNRQAHVIGTDIAVRLDRYYGLTEDGFEEPAPFWGEEHGIEGALKRARAWAVTQEDDEDTE
jgi:hypothetical protein